jgi:hypothetical protein
MQLGNGSQRAPHNLLGQVLGVDADVGTPHVVDATLGAILATGNLGLLPNCEEMLRARIGETSSGTGSARPSRSMTGMPHWAGWPANGISTRGLRLARPFGAFGRLRHRFCHRLRRQDFHRGHTVAHEVADVRLDHVGV